TFGHRRQRSCGSFQARRSAASILRALAIVRSVGSDGSCTRVSMRAMYSGATPAFAARAAWLSPAPPGAPSKTRAFLNRGAPSVDGELRAVNETGAIRRQEDYGLGNLVRCSRTARRRLGGQLLESLAHGVRAFRARRAGTHRIDADTTRAIFRRPRFGQQV